MTTKTACPDCGLAGSRYGQRDTKQAYLDDDGKLCRRSASVQRWRCAECARVYQDSPGPDHVEAMNAVAESVMHVGLAGAARKHGCDDGTASRILADWCALRADEISTATPEVLGVASVPLAGRTCAIAFCVESGQIVDFVEDVSAVGKWIRMRNDRPVSVCLEIDAGVLASLSPLEGDVRLMVPPSAAARSIEAGALALFRRLVRGGAPGRNYRESTALFRKPQADLTDDDRDELGNWNEAPRKLRFVAATLGHDVVHGEPAAAADSMRMTSALLAAIAPASALAAFLSLWAPAILRGVEDRWIDSCMADAASLRREVAALRPQSGYDRLRAIAMFATPRGPSASARTSFGPLIADVRTSVAVHGGGAI